MFAVLTNLNLNLLRSLFILLEECHVSRAAARLHLTQSAVSRQLAQLRELCDDPLLVRNGHDLVPTPKALSLQEKLRQLLPELESLLVDSQFQPDTCQQHFVFSSSDYVAQFIFPDIVARITREAPLINLEYVLWQRHFLHQFYDTGIHVASTILANKPEHLSSALIGNNERVCLMRAQHPLCAKEQVSAEDLLAYPHAQVTGGGDKDSALDTLFRSQGRQRRVALKVPFFSAAVNALLQSDYLLVVPTHIAGTLVQQASLTYRPFTPAVAAQMPVQQYWLIWHPKYDLDEAHLWFRQQILATMAQSAFSI